MHQDNYKLNTSTKEVCICVDGSDENCSADEVDDSDMNSTAEKIKDVVGDWPAIVYLDYVKDIVDVFYGILMLMNSVSIYEESHSSVKLELGQKSETLYLRGSS